MAETLTPQETLPIYTLLESNITIGVELELIICNLPYDLPIDTHFELLADTLKPLAEKCRTSVIDMVNTTNTELEVKDIIAAFQVQNDISIDTGTVDIYNHRVQRGAEIATPILKNKQWEWVIPEMTQILLSAYKLDFNYSTGLHIHVGIGRDYTLQDLKRISKAVILFEKQMDTYHPAYRCPTKRTESTPYHNPCILSNRESTALNGLNNIVRLRKIEAADNIQNLLSIINSKCSISSNRNHSRYYRYNLTSTLNYGTVEFRQAAATDDGNHIVDWIGRVIRFVMSAIATPDSKFHAWAGTGVTDPEVYRSFGVPVPGEYPSHEMRFFGYSS